MSNRTGRPPALRELQHWLAASILAPQQPEQMSVGALQVHSWLTVPAGVDLQDRLAVYTNGYPARLLEALKETFPALAHLLGGGTFALLTRRYIEATPLHSYNLNDAGENLANFLRSDELAEKLPFTPDLALLEWYAARAFHAHDKPPLKPSTLASWQLEDWDRAVLHFQPSVAIVRSAWPIREIWEAREIPREEIHIDLQDRPDDVLVQRHGLGVDCTSIGSVEADVLQALIAGQSLGEVSTTLIEHGQDPAEVTAWFAAWMQAGLIFDCTR